MLTKDDIKKLQREYPEGVPPEYLTRGYTAGHIRRLMNMRKTPTNDDAMVPEHRLSGMTREQWEDTIFTRAAHFTVIVGRNPWSRMRQQFGNWPATRAAAGPVPNAMAYAVTATGHSVMLPRLEWDRYDRLWQHARGK